jgi:urease accessory protein
VRLELKAGNDSKTHLGSCYQQVPLRLFPPFHFADEPAALIYLVNPTAGLMDGDGHRVEIVAHPETCCVITGQSATRVHPAVNSFATQQWTLRVEAGAKLVILPGPIIPFRGCRYYQNAAINLAADARLIWADIWLPGRYARGDVSERFQFERLVQQLEIRREGKLVFRERFDWKGPWDNETIAWHFGDGLAIGTLFVSGPFTEAPAMKGESSTRRAVLRLASGDTCVRWSGLPSRVIQQVVFSGLSQAAYWSDPACQRPWLLDSHSLAPNHWFSANGL